MRHKLTKKALSLLVTLAMLLSMVPVAYAEEAEQEASQNSVVEETDTTGDEENLPDVPVTLADEGETGTTKVAEVDGVEYETLQEAIAVSKSSDTVIKLLTDIDVGKDKPIEITSNSGTLDLKGHKLTGQYWNNGILHFKDFQDRDNVNFTIQDTVGGGGIINTAASSDETDYTSAILVKSTSHKITLTIKGGTFDCPNAIHALDWSSYGTVTIEGGIFKKQISKRDETGHSNLVIRGGTYSFDPTEYVDTANYTVTDNSDGTWTVTAKTYVAQIGEIKYETLTDAIAAANSAAESVTVKLLEDVTLDTDLQIGSGSTERTITVDLNGKTIDGGTVAQVYTAGNHTVEFTGNGTITNSKTVKSNQDAPLNIYNGSQVILNGVTVTGNYGVYTSGKLDILNAAINAVDCGIAVNQSAQVTIGSNDPSVNSEVTVTASAGNCISTQAKQGTANMNVTIYNGTFTSKKCDGATWVNATIYWASHGTLNVYDGTFDNGNTSAAAALFQKNGTVNVYGGSFTAQDGIKAVAQSDSTEITANITGGTFTGSRSGIYVDASRSDYMGQLTTYGVTISNGESSSPVFTDGAQQGAIYTKEDGLTSRPEGTKAMTISGGTFYGETAETMASYLANGYMFDEGTSTVVPAVTYVAKIGDVKYATLQEAISASKGAETTIELLSDVTLNSTITTTGWFTLDLAGHTIDGGSDLVFECWYGTVKIKDTSEGQTGQITTTADTAISVHGDLSHDNTVEIQGGTIHSSGNAVYVDSYATAKISGGVLDGTAFASGRSAKSVAKIDITGGTVNGGIWAQDYSNVTVSGDDTLIKGGMTIFRGGTADAYNSTALVSGGRFQYSPDSDLLASGKEAVWNGSYYVVRKKADPVAQIGNTKYTSLQDAILAATGEANTIELLADVTGASTITINKNLTLDLNGKSIRCSGTGNWDYTVNVKDGTVIIKNSGGTPSTIEQTVGNRALWISGGKVTLGSGVTVTSRGYAMCVCDTGKFILDGGTVHSDEEYGIYEMMYSANKAPEVIIESGTVEAPASTGNGIGIVITGYDSSTYAPILTVNGGTVSGGDSAISGKGDTGNTVINITGGTVKGGTIGIYHPQAGTLTLKGGEITGGTGIYAKSGTVTVPADSAVKVQGTGERAEYKYQTSGCVSTGDALVLESCGYPGGLVSAAIAGGTFTSAKASAVAAYTQDEETYPALTKFLTGGTYSSNPSTYVATGYEAVKDAEANTWTVQKAKVAEIVGGAQYETLAEAIAAAQSGQTVQLLADVDLQTAYLNIDKSITLDLAGYEISSSNSTCAAWVTGSLTLKDGSTAKTGKISVAGMVAILTGDANAVVTVEGGAVAGQYGIFAQKGASVSVKGGVIEGTTCGVAVLGTSKLSVTGGKIFGKNEGYAIAGNGSNDGTTITISGGEIVSEIGTAIYHPQEGNLTITGGKITGYNGIQYCGAGELTITGGEITATAPYTEYPTKPSTQGDGTANDGAALSLVSRGGGYQDGDKRMDVTISGGTLTSENNAAIAVYRLQKVNGVWTTNANTSVSSYLGKLEITNGNFNGGDQKGALEIDEASKNEVALKGGTYSSDVNEYCAAGYEAVKSTGGSTKYVIQAKTPVSEVKPIAPEVKPIAGNSNQDVTNAAGSISDKLTGSSDDIVSGDGLTAAQEQAKKDATDSNATNTETAKNQLNKELGAGTATDESIVNIVVQNYTKVEVTGVEKESDVQDAKLKSVTLNITPMVRTVATTAGPSEEIRVKEDNAQDPNAVVVIAEDKLDITGEVTVKVPVPDNFVKTTANDKVWVIHKTDDRKRYVYQGIVDANKNVTFTNPHGFSEFTIVGDAEQIPEAAIVGTDKTGTLEKMMTQATSNQVIQLLKDKDTTATNLLITGYTLDLNGFTLEANFVGALGSGAVMDSSNGKGLLKIAKNVETDKKLCLPTGNAQMPLYDDASKGYRFFDLSVQYATTVQSTASQAKMYFRLKFTNNDAYKLLSQSDNGDLSVTVTLGWDDMKGDGVLVKFTSATVKKLGDKFTQDPKKDYGLVLIVNGIGSLAGKNMTAKMTVSSSTYAVHSVTGTHTVTTKS